MSDSTRRYEITIDAPVHEVFEYCRDPRHLFGGWSGQEVTGVHMTPEGVGTTAHIVGTFMHGMMVEQIEREFTEFVPDEHIVSTAHGTMRFAGRTKDVAHPPIFTWLFDAQDGATRVTFVVREEDLGWWQNLFESCHSARIRRRHRGTRRLVPLALEGAAGGADGSACS